MLLASLLLSASLGSLPGDPVVFVQRGRPVAVVAEAWKREGRYLTATGEGHDLHAEPGLGAGDFAVEAVLAIETLNGTAAAFQLGENWFGFDGKGETLFTNGPLFGGGVKFHGAARDHFSEGRDFRFEVVRSSGQLTISIEGDEILSVPSRSSLHPIGFQPMRSVMRLRSFTASGDVEARPSPDKGPNKGPDQGQRGELVEIQQSIDDAIDGGVEFLLSTQLRDGSWGAFMPKYRGGQTGFAAYTLLKAGLSSSHPAVERALLFLELHEPVETYSAAVQLMAFAEAGDERYLKRMEELVDRLVEWRLDKSWGYPWNFADGIWADSKGRTDLSNTQFAVLGLRAARKVGIEVDPRVWLDAIEGTLALKAAEEDVALGGADERSSKRKTRIGGFIYRHQGGFPATLTMTEAGITILHSARDALGKRLRGRQRREVDEAIETAFAWISHRFALTNEGAKGDPWHYYHLYGLERVGSLLDREQMGSHRWYFEGASYLVAKQAKDGSWKDQHAEPDTCFALLFLKRATQPSSGAAAKTTKKGKQLHQAEGRNHALQIRGLGDQDLTLFVTGFADKDVHVIRIEYLVDGEVIATIESDPKRSWNGEQLAARHRFHRTGTYRVTARAFLTDDVEAECPGFDVTVARVDAPWARSAATAAERDVLDPSGVTASASSQHGTNVPAYAIDGLAATRWLSQADDSEPALVLDFDRAVRATKLVLGQADASYALAGECDRVTRVAVQVNGRAPFEVELEPDPMQPTQIPLPRGTKVKRLELRILERQKGTRWPGRAGFAQVALEKD